MNLKPLGRQNNPQLFLWMITPVKVTGMLRSSKFRKLTPRYPKHTPGSLDSLVVNTPVILTPLCWIDRGVLAPLWWLLWGVLLPAQFNTSIRTGFKKITGAWYNRESWLPCLVITQGVSTPGSIWHEQVFLYKLIKVDSQYIHHQGV